MKYSSGYNISLSCLSICRWSLTVRLSFIFFLISCSDMNATYTKNPQIIITTIQGSKIMFNFKTTLPENDTRITIAITVISRQTRRIRTITNRTKIYCATITPYFIMTAYPSALFREDCGFIPLHQPFCYTLKW